MTTEEQELLNEATQRYPVGTVYLYEPFDNKEVTVVEELKLHNIEGSIIITDGCGGAVYNEGTWAEIISLPEPTINELMIQVDHKIKLMEERMGK